MTPPPKRGRSSLEARFAAQRIAWGPVAFQAARCLRDFGILAALEEAADGGLRLEEIVAAVDVSEYGVTVLLEGGLSFDLVAQDEDRWTLTPTGYYLLKDELTRVNMDFVHDVNYLGFFQLDRAIRAGRPAGLEVFGDWPTIYAGLSELPPHVRRSWLAFDHYYSDSAFPDVLPVLFDDDPPRRLLDVGGNTGKWALQCAAYSPDVRLTILDHPQQLALAQKNLEEHGVRDRVELVPVDLLDHAVAYPGGHDAVWMSQFLCCFPETDIVQLLRRAADAVRPGGTVYVLDTYWDRQPHPIATYCLHATSLYFTCLANGTSRMYDARTMLRCVHAAGLEVEREVDRLGLSHTLFVCRPR